MTNNIGDKHSVGLNGRKTSVSLEPEFWTALTEMAKVRNQTIQSLIEEIETTKQQRANLSSTIRVYLFREVLAEAARGRIAA